MASEENYLKRAEKVGLTQAALASAANLDVQTVNRLYAERPRGPLMTTIRKVGDVVEARELEVLDHLLPIHIEARIDRIAELLRHRGFRLEKEAA